jgi:hypothetical protein
LCPAIPVKQLLARDFFCDPSLGTPLNQGTAEQGVQSIGREHAFAKAAAASQSFYT